MEYQLVVIKISRREQAAAAVQQQLTGFGCNIKVRLGLHDLPAGQCTPSGLIILEVTGEQQEIDKLLMGLEQIDGVTARYMTI